MFGSGFPQQCERPLSADSHQCSPPTSSVSNVWERGLPMTRCSTTSAPFTIEPRCYFVDIDLLTTRTFLFDPLTASHPLLHFEFAPWPTMEWGMHRHCISERWIHRFFWFACLLGSDSPEQNAQWDPSKPSAHPLHISFGLSKVFKKNNFEETNCQISPVTWKKNKFGFTSH